jgi:hypothetical protein
MKRSFWFAKETTMAKRFYALTLAVIAGPLLFIEPSAAEKSATTKPVPLRVTVHDTDSDGFACGMCSDGLGDYVDGIDGVAAALDQYGNIIINFQTGRSPVRKLHYDYSFPLQGQTLQPPTDPPNNYFSTVGLPGSPLRQLMPVGSEQCIVGGPLATLDDFDKTQYRNVFHREWAGFDYTDTSYLVVTRTSTTTWEVEPKSASCNTGIPKVMRLLQTPTRRQFNFTDDGLYQMPLRMTLTAHP